MKGRRGEWYFYLRNNAPWGVDRLVAGYVLWPPRQSLHALPYYFSWCNYMHELAVLADNNVKVT